MTQGQTTVSLSSAGTLIPESRTRYYRRGADDGTELPKGSAASSDTLASDAVGIAEVMATQTIGTFLVVAANENYRGTGFVRVDRVTRIGSLVVTGVAIVGLAGDLLAHSTIIHPLIGIIALVTSCTFLVMTSIPRTHS